MHNYKSKLYKRNADGQLMAQTKNAIQSELSERSSDVKFQDIHTQVKIVDSDAQWCPIFFITGTTIIDDCPN